MSPYAWKLLKQFLYNYFNTGYPGDEENLQAVLEEMKRLEKL
jgi:hypothetical protein